MQGKPVFIDLSPSYTDWNNWHSGIAHILGEQQLPFVPNEDDWRQFALAFSELPLLAQFSVPDVEEFANWQDWAESLITAANGNFYV